MIKVIVNKYLKSKEATNASWIIVGRIIQMILSFVVSIISARYLGPSNFGVINYAAAYVAFFTSLCTLGINTIIVKDFISNPNDQGVALGTTLVFRAIASALSSVLIISIVAIIDKGEKTTIIVTGLCSLALIFQVFDTINFWFQARYKSKVTALATLIAYIITSVYKIILFIFQKDVTWFAFATSVDYICLAIFLFLAYKGQHGPQLSFSWEKGKELIGQSYHYILSGMMVAIYAQTDRLMLKHMLDTTVVGYYSLASSINSMWVFVLAAIIDSMVPTIIKYHKENNNVEFNKTNRRLYSIIIYISIFVAICMMIFGKTAIVTIYGESYGPSSKALTIICWYTVFSYLGAARNVWIVCKNQQKYLKYMYFSAAIINVILNLVMIPLWGMVGAAIASLTTQICTSIVLPLFIKDMKPNVKLMIEAFLLKEIK